MSNPRNLLHAFGLEPKKSLGQNFLHDPNALRKIVASAELMPDETVLEIGAGTGALTAHLAGAARRVVAVEVDERLIPILRRELAVSPNVEIVLGNILDYDIDKLVGPGAFVVVANLPYYITSAILRHLLEAAHKPRRLVLTVQTEVAERLTARPGQMSLLAVSVQFYGQPRIVTRLKPAAFWPRPDVESAVVVIDVYNSPPVPASDERRFFEVVRAGFGQRRKQLKNALSGGLRISNAEAEALLSAAGIDPRRRAETLSLDEWAVLAGPLK